MTFKSMGRESCHKFHSVWSLRLNVRWAQWHPTCSIRLISFAFLWWATCNGNSPTMKSWSSPSVKEFWMHLGRPSCPMLSLKGNLRHDDYCTVVTSSWIKLPLRDGRYPIHLGNCWDGWSSSVYNMTPVTSVDCPSLSVRWSHPKTGVYVHIIAWL